MTILIDGNSVMVIEENPTGVWRGSFTNEDSLAAVVGKHQAKLLADQLGWVKPTPPAKTINQIVEGRIEDAKVFGAKLMVEFGAKNVLRGLTTSQVAEIMATLSTLKDALDSGSLYVALDILAAIVPDETLIRTEDVTYFRNKIQTYLGITII